ncbi:methionine adenosyltransferase [Candidatus Phytoplasma sacchari]|uniref:Methionine adenosyltransferase n=1 Tax=Candidatus Phytoplasma sacchari TaxID=2609813 RepID=A0ABY7M1I7_9MOLU|nr:methionine adenosyltransferase [Candidatus Phytoplasma sacchari]
MKKFSAEAVTQGHPDKVADQISDVLLDAYIKKDKKAKIAIETVVTKKKVILFGEINTKNKLTTIEIENLVREKIKEIGYINKEDNFYFNNVRIINFIQKQSNEISKAVENNGAGDQGSMFGFATNETSVFLPLSLYLARKLASKLTEVRENKKILFLKPDGKTQITLVYDDKNRPIYIDNVVISCQHEKNINKEYLEKEIINKIVRKTIKESLINSKTKIYINPCGSFTLGGPAVDTGLTGRKIVQDSYGSEIRHGGGCFSGKDCTKVDRCGAYMARYLAKNIVASGICNKCEIQISYAIGLKKPVSLYINTFKTSKVDESLIIKTIKNYFDLSPQGIIKMLDLEKPIFAITSKEGHFGRKDNLFSWEKLDKKDIFAQLL